LAAIAVTLRAISLMEKTTPEQEEQHPFREILSVLSTEDLLRLKHRLQKKKKKHVIELLDEEIQRKKINSED
jgi:hypothetical protein